MKRGEAAGFSPGWGGPSGRAQEGSEDPAGAGSMSQPRQSEHQCVQLSYIFFTLKIKSYKSIKHESQF